MFNFLWGVRLKYILEKVAALELENTELRAENKFLRDLNDSERQERQELNAILLKRAGYIESDNPTSPTAFKPFSRATSTWPSIKRKLEKQALQGDSVIVSDEKIILQKDAANLKSVEEEINNAG